MKKIKNSIVLFFLLSLSLNVNAQKLKTSQDSTKVFYDKIFKSLEVAYLYRKDFD